MAQTNYRVNLSAKTFPMIASNWGRTVIVPQYEQSNKVLASSEDDDKDAGLPQAYYLEDVMPHQQGWQSVAYKTILSNVGPFIEFLSILHVYDSLGNVTHVAVESTGKLYSIKSDDTWKDLGSYGNVVVSAAHVEGISYIWVKGVGCYKYDFGTDALVAVTLTGLTPADINGITSSGGYLIAWTDDTIYWSSTIDPTDFTPSLVTGAGAGKLEGAKGEIITCLPISQGFIAYTSGNAVVGLASGNSRYPFSFRELAAAGGLESRLSVTRDSSITSHYAYTSDGLQQISAASVVNVFPAVTDFLSGRILESFDPVTLQFTLTETDATLRKRLTLVANRYLVISYGLHGLSHALIYDITLKRWGKVKVDHAACFEYKRENDAITETARQTIAFMLPQGGIKLLDMKRGATGAVGVLLLGKFQFHRSRLAQLNEIEVESTPETNAFSLTVLTALDGKNTQIASDTALIKQDGEYKRYGCRAIGTNISLVFQGEFYLNSVEIGLSLHGRR